MNTDKILKEAKRVLYYNIYKEDDKLGDTNKVLFTKRRVIVPSNPYYYGFWNWDGAFHMIGAALFGDGGLAADQADTMFDLQLGDGMFIDCARVDGSRVADFSKPPVWPWAFEAADRLLPFKQEYLRKAFEKLKSNLEWWERERYDGTLFSYKVHPYESGMDDSPRFDEPYQIENLWAVDANAFMYGAYSSMFYIAERIGDQDATEKYLKKAKILKDKINSLLFSEKLHAYCDYDKESKTHTGCLTPMSFVPLFAHCADVEKAADMEKIAADSAFFRGGMPTVAYNDKGFEAALFWRGPCWLNTAYFAVKGLADYGFESLALEYCEEILSWVEHDGIWEYYDTGKKQGIGQSDFSWSAVFSALFVYMYRELGGK